MSPLRNVGEISVESELGKGSVFRVDLPFIFPSSNLTIFLLMESPGPVPSQLRE